MTLIATHCTCTVHRLVYADIKIWYEREKHVRKRPPLEQFLSSSPGSADYLLSVGPISL
jgi:hypothetical protein